MALTDHQVLQYLLASYEPRPDACRKGVVTWVGNTGAGKSTGVAVQTGATFRRDSEGRLVLHSNVRTPRTSQCLESQTLHPATFPDYKDPQFVHVDTGGYFDTRGPLYATWTAQSVAGVVASSKVLQCVVATVSYTNCFPSSRAPPAVIHSWADFAAQMQTTFPSHLVSSDSMIYFVSKAFDMDMMATVSRERLNKDIDDYIAFAKKSISECGARLRQTHPKQAAAVRSALGEIRGALTDVVAIGGQQDEDEDLDNHIKNALTGVHLQNVPRDNEDMAMLHKIQGGVREIIRFRECLMKGRVVLSDPSTFLVPEGCKKQREKVGHLVARSMPLNGPRLTAAVSQGHGVEFADLLVLAAQQYTEPLKDLSNVAAEVKTEIENKETLLRRLEADWRGVKEERLKALREEFKQADADMIRIEKRIEHLRTSERHVVITEEQIHKLNTGWQWFWGVPVTHSATSGRDIPIFTYRYEQEGGDVVSAEHTYERDYRKLTVDVSAKWEIKGTVKVIALEKDTPVAKETVTHEETKLEQQKTLCQDLRSRIQTLRDAGNKEAVEGILAADFQMKKARLEGLREWLQGTEVFQRETTYEYCRQNTRRGLACFLATMRMGGLLKSLDPSVAETLSEFERVSREANERLTNPTLRGLLGDLSIEVVKVAQDVEKPTNLPLVVAGEVAEKLEDLRSFAQDVSVWSAKKGFEVFMGVVHVAAAAMEQRPLETGVFLLALSLMLLFRVVNSFQGLVVTLAFPLGCVLTVRATVGTTGRLSEQLQNVHQALSRFSFWRHSETMALEFIAALKRMKWSDVMEGIFAGLCAKRSE
uniref:Uncharacterized protein n=1 Tax=Chromera velia CCMP2878 TaxID=1169474 RepID=A0A0G4F8T5_9ALVE|eukprot:Cvel_2952.t1-p1 / transcript=Cvel_2952.t1 / gene=Cvel_2952 / organism=Chromera_velia_CCMP2878 / gene_product=hypothetical protein / transcript_product=hypothetical protein / location=Cvel_scaffold116:122109-124751(+) / protein_length=817 / sequence_SO=supercontig / SO=protein_coding / is_pseudo=false